VSTSPSTKRDDAGLKVQVMSALRWSAVAKLGGQIVNWAITLIVIRLLAPADYGLVAMLAIVFTFMTMLGEMGFGSSLVQAKDLEAIDIRRTFGAALLINSGICVLMFAAAPAVAAFYNEPRLVDMARVSALGFLLSGVGTVYDGLLQREMRFRALARVEIVTGVVGNLATLGFAYAGFGAWALILSPLVASPTRIAMLWSCASRHYWPSFDFRGTRRLWSFGGNVLATRVVWYWSSQADALIAGKLLGKEALGFYSVAVHLASLPMQRAAGMINGVAFAAFAKIQDDARAVTANTRLGVRLMALVTFPTMWGIAAIAPELVDVAIGPNWHASIMPLTLVALMIPFRMIGSIISTTIMSMGRVDVALWTTIIGACIAPPIYLYASRFGLLGLSAAWLVTTPILFMLNMFRALPIVGLSLRGVAREIWRPVVVSALMLGAVSLLRQALGGQLEVLILIQLVIAGAVVYLGGSWLLNRSASTEALSLLFPKRFAHFATAR
jgi:teichuronic acid exporter